MERSRITLRPLTEPDVTPEYISWLNNPEIRRYLGIRHKKDPFQKEDILEFLRLARQNRRFHWGIYVDHLHVGNVSCSAWSHDNRWIDISYLVGDRGVQGRGIATLAVGAAMKYLFEKKEYRRIQAGALVENKASIRVMEKLGMRRDALLRRSAYLPDENRFTDEVIYSALKEEWVPPSQEINEVSVLPMHWEKQKEEELSCKK